MKVAICGNPLIGSQLKDFLKTTDIEITHIIANEKNIGRGGQVTPKIISFLEFKQMESENLIDGVIIADDSRSIFTKHLVKLFKLHSIKNVGIVDFFLPPPTANPKEIIYWLDMDKGYIPHIESNIIDSCNLNCRGCTHFSAFFNDNDFYDIKDFKRDVRRISETVDLIRFLILGGEPLKKPDLAEFIEVARNYLPKTNIRIITNGLLIPSASQKVFDTMKKNRIALDITNYPPTSKILDRITDTLNKNQIAYRIGSVVQNFLLFFSLTNGHDPNQSRKVCTNDACRYMRDGRIYKCPIDGLVYRYAETFGIENFAKSTSIDIFASNFVSMLDMLDGEVELCGWCNEQNKIIPWQTSSHYVKEDWLY